MAKHQLVSVVIPCFNDAVRIYPIIKEIKKSQFLGEIIVVDDGSNQHNKKILTGLTGIKLITHSFNRGKSHALKTGVKSVTFPYVAFIDSDLTNFRTCHFDNLVVPVISGLCDISISDKELELPHSRLTGFSIAYTGERCMTKSFLDNHPSIFDTPGYLIESRLNEIIISGGYRVHKVLFDNVGQCTKAHKMKPLEGWYKDIKMLSTIIDYLGPRQFIRQLTYFSNLD